MALDEASVTHIRSKNQEKKKQIICLFIYYFFFKPTNTFHEQKMFSTLFLKYFIDRGNFTPLTEQLLRSTKKNTDQREH